MRYLSLLVVFALLFVSVAESRPPQELPFSLPLPGKPGAVWQSSAVVCAESSHSYDVRHYRLDFDLPMTHAGYTCREQVCIASNAPSLDTFSLDFDGLVCDSVKRSGIPQVFSTPPGLLKIDLASPVPLGDSALLDIFFHRESTAVQNAYYFCRPPTRIYAHAMTCGCPTNNHFWFACYDHPSDKAERGCMINLTVPDTFQTSSNGLCDSVTVNPGNQTRTYWWRHPYPICTYLMTFSASRFASWQDTVVGQTGDTIPIIHFMWPQDSAPSRTGFARLPDMIEYFSDTLRFGPYPFERFGFIPGYYGFPWGGMEHQTTVMLHTSYIPGGSDIVQAHELSHMWWGDMLTHVGYADVWLNEGFATWAEVLYMGHQQGRAYFANLMRGRASSFFSRDRTYRFPIYNPPWSQIYDYGTIYCKGAWVEHMLRYVVGDTAWESPGIFFTALRAYRDSFPYGTASTEDYKRVNEQVTGMDLDWFFDEWIYQAGFPRYYLNWTKEPAGDSFRVVTYLTQQNGNLAPPVFHMPLPVRFSGQGQDTLVTIRPQASPQIDTFLLHFRPDEAVTDPDNWVLDSTYYTGVAEEPKSSLRIPDFSGFGVASSPARREVRFQVWAQPEPAAQLEITDAAGRLVRTIPIPYSITHTPYSIVWDRLDSSARSVPAGVYFCRLSTERSTSACRVTLVD